MLITPLKADLKDKAMQDMKKIGEAFAGAMTVYK